MPPDPKTILVLINASGGGVKALGVARQRDAIVKSFARHAIIADVRAVQGRDLVAAVAASDGAIVVGGGDGSLAAAAGVLVDSGRPLGVLPLGTLNHFAKDLGLATLDAAVDAIAAGRRVQVDVGEVAGRVFVNNSSVGFYPRMVAERSREQRASGMPKWPAMVLAALRTIRHFPRHRLSIRVDGRDTPCVTPCVFVGNNDYELAGLNLGKRNRLDGGGLFLLIVNGSTLWSLVALSVRTALGRVEQAEDIEVIQGVPRIRIESNGHSLEVAADGEVFHAAVPIEYRIRPKALTVFAAAPARAEPV